ncbi:MAG: hypothetical protein KQJ78_14725 [Deltaproteobacteria bacterium]|nr:hypothetical protein [Deltaproteobacteria bacterium]
MSKKYLSALEEMALELQNKQGIYDSLLESSGTAAEALQREFDRQELIRRQTMPTWDHERASSAASVINAASAATAIFEDSASGMVAYNETSEQMRVLYEAALPHIQSEFFRPDLTLDDRFQSIQEQIDSYRIYKSLSEELLPPNFFNELKSNLAYQETNIQSLQDALSDFSSSAERLAVYAAEFPDSEIVLSSIVPTVGHELFLNNFVVRKIAEYEKGGELDNETEFVVEPPNFPRVDGEFEGLLGMVDPRLLNKYRGAKLALNSNNPDKYEQLLASLRSLWENLLKKLAPDAEVITWAKINGSMSDKHLFQDRSKGIVKKRARLRFIYRNMPHDILSVVLESDEWVLDRIFRVFNRIHEADMGLTQDMANLLIFRTDCFLGFVLRVHSLN